MWTKLVLIPKDWSKSKIWQWDDRSHFRYILLLKNATWLGIGEKRFCMFNKWISHGHHSDQFRSWEHSNNTVSYGSWFGVSINKYGQYLTSYQLQPMIKLTKINLFNHLMEFFHEINACKILPNLITKTGSTFKRSLLRHAPFVISILN